MTSDELRNVVWSGHDSKIQQAAMDAAAQIDRLNSRVAELQAGLNHMRWCSSCAEGAWEDCDGGRAALAAIDSAMEASR